MRTKVGGAVQGEPSAEMEGCRDEDPGVGGLGGNKVVTFRARAPHPGLPQPRQLDARLGSRPMRAARGTHQPGALHPALAPERARFPARIRRELGIRARGSPHLPEGSKNHELGSSGRRWVRALPSKPVCLPAHPPARRPAGRARTLEMFPQQLPPWRAPAQP